MTFVIWLITVACALLVWYIAVEVYARWSSTRASKLSKLRENIGELRDDINHRLQLAEQRAYSHYDSIYKNLWDLQEDIKRLKEWQQIVDKIVTDYNIASQKLQKLQEQQALYHPTHKRATKRRKL
jgi:predicted phage-related endonuclease